MERMRLIERRYQKECAELKEEAQKKPVVFVPQAVYDQMAQLLACAGKTFIDLDQQFGRQYVPYEPGVTERHNVIKSASGVVVAST